jgi:hypothetical protein
MVRDHDDSFGAQSIRVRSGIGEAGSRDSSQLENRPSTLGLDHACVLSPPITIVELTMTPALVRNAFKLGLPSKRQAPVTHPS